MTVLTRYRFRPWPALGAMAVLTIMGVLMAPVVAHRLQGAPRHLAATSAPGWTWPANPALIPGLLSSDQEIALNAQVYPVAFVRVTDTAGLRLLQRLATTKSTTPHRIGFLALVGLHPRSDRAAVTTAARWMHRDGITLPWVVVLDPPAAWRISALQVYWPTAHGIGHAIGGEAALKAWQQATAPVRVTSTQVVPQHSAAGASRKTPKSPPRRSS